MKKVVTILLIIFCILGCTIVYGANEDVIDKDTKSTLVEIKDKELNTLEDYKEAYGSETYGITAYILNKVRIYSIPLGFTLIAIGAIYQFIIGIRKLDIRDKGFALIIATVTLLVICQILPLVFAIVVKGWRG